MGALHLCCYIFIVLFHNATTTEVSSELRHLLSGVTPGFEENLKRAFRNEGVRRQAQRNRKNEDLHSLDDVLIHYEGNIIELKRLAFQWRPDFRIAEMAVDLAMLTLDAALNLGDLRVEGAFEANNRTLQKVLPVSHCGRIEFFFENVTAAGKIGLTIREDSFLPQNYDIDYKPKDVTVRVAYHADKDKEIANELVEQSLESILVKTFWNQLTETITSLLHRRLGAVLVELSVSETLADNDAELRDHLRQHVTKANRLLDSLLCSAKDHLVAADSRTVETPPFSVVFRGRPTTPCQGTLETGPGYVQDLSTLTRVQDMSFFEDKEKLVVYGYLQLRDFKHGYEKYEGEYSGTKIRGSIKSVIYRNRIFVKISVTKNERDCTTRLETVQLRLLKDIDMDASGLASLSWLTQQVGSWLTGNLRHQGIPVLEKNVAEAFRRAIDSTDCVALLID